MEKETDTNCSSSKQDPVVTCMAESPLKRLTKRKRLRNETYTPGTGPSTKKVKTEIESLDDHKSTARIVEDISFELYSHSTDPFRNLQSVNDVAGIPLVMKQENTCNEAHCKTTLESVSQPSGTLYIPSTGTPRTSSSNSTGYPELLSVNSTEPLETNHTGSHGTSFIYSTETSTEDSAEPSSISSLCSTEPPGLPFDYSTEPETPFIPEPLNTPFEKSTGPLSATLVWKTADVSCFKPFSKFSLGRLDSLSELGSNTLYNLSCYVDLLESLISQRLFIPAGHLSQVLTLAINSPSDFVSRFHFVLSQDLVIRDSSMPTNDFLYETIHSLVEELGTNCSHIPSLVVLCYMTELLKKNNETCKSSLKRRLNSLCSKILDLALACVSESIVPHSIISLPSLTTMLLILLSLVTLDEKSLAGRISCRLDSLTTTADKCLLLRSVPSHFLREMIIDIHLETFFVSENLDCFPLVPNTLKDISVKHFRRRPYRPNGEPHDLSLFLSLLCMLVESHLIHINERDGLQDLQRGVQILTNTLYDDPFWIVKLSECDVWFSLQLLTALAQQ